MRIYKQSGGIGVPSESFYLISAGGVMYSIEETRFHSNGNGNSTMERYNIPDLGYEDQNKEINYQIQDHLGNLRLSYTVLHCPSCSEQNCASVDVQYQINYIAEYLAYGGLLREFVRNGTAGEKFLSTGHERDKQTGWDYRQARYYDADLGRFLAVDPKANELLEWSSYSYGFNNPFLFFDPDGQKPVPITSRQFRHFANTAGIKGNQQIGSYFERLSIASLQTTKPVFHNTNRNFFSPVRFRMNDGLPASVRPDGISAYPGGSSLGEVFISPSFYEVKATNKRITKRYRKGQITGMIDVLANMDRRPNEIASLTLVTTSDAKISDEILDYATRRGVVIFHSIAALDDETGEFILSEKTLLNGNAISTFIDQLMKLNGRYDEFNGVNPKNYLNGTIAFPGDPDPATIEDR